jgi:hypothetical protein
MSAVWLTVQGLYGAISPIIMDTVSEVEGMSCQHECIVSNHCLLLQLSPRVRPPLP